MERTPAAHLSRGRKAEDTACRHLRKKGLKLIARNFRSPFGEIDLIMRHGETFVFVEVRYRNTAAYGDPAETVTARKQAKLRATAQYYLLRNKTASMSPCRFDIVAVTGGEDTINWLQNAFY